MAICVIALSFSISAEADLAKFRRSSLYTIIVKSDKESRNVDKQQDSGNIITELIKDNTTKETNADDSIPKSQLILDIFTSNPIPDQFDDMNLATRVLD